MLYCYLNTHKGFMLCQWVILAQWIYSLSLVTPWGFSLQCPEKQLGAGRELQALAKSAAACSHPSPLPSKYQNRGGSHPTSDHLDIITLKAVSSQGLFCMRKTLTSAEGTASPAASEEDPEVLALFTLSSEISALADWHFSCSEKIDEEKISWRKIDGDQTNH